jgi:AAA family ATP:ADP antiporter
MAAIDGVEYIPQAKIASLFVVFALVIVCKSFVLSKITVVCSVLTCLFSPNPPDNKLLDMFPKHQLFYMMGGAYGVLFTAMGFALMHPTIGLANTKADPTRILGWLSYVTIESFGSMVVQCYWALVNASVDVNFAKKNFGIIVAGAQIGSILGPTVATQADIIGIPVLYLGGAAIMFMMITAMYLYVERFGVPAEEKEGASKSSKSSKSGKEEGIMEGFYLMYEHDYVKGIFVISSLFMVQVTVIDYMMKVLAKDRYAMLYPDDPDAALRGFASFMGYFGQATNSISFLFSLFGTGMVIKKFGLTATLIAFPALLLGCTVLVWMAPNIWMVFFVMMVIKGMSYALNNPTKEILYQMTSTNIKFKCKSWIDTFGQRSSKAAGSLITNAFATSMVELVNYGSLVGIFSGAFLIWVSGWMGKEFDERSVSGEKVGEESSASLAAMGAAQNRVDDTSCVADGSTKEAIGAAKPEV